MNLEELDLHSTQALREFILQAFKDSPKRRDHILSVSSFCRETAEKLCELHPKLQCNPDEAERAGLLHDIGYLPSIRIYLQQKTPYEFYDWHPMDGANYLRHRKEPRLAELIEGHGNSREVAVLKGLPPVTHSDDIVAQIVTFCDSQTGPTGERVSYTARLQEITERHGATSVAARAHLMAKPRVEKIISEVETMLSKTA